MSRKVEELLEELRALPLQERLRVMKQVMLEDKRAATQDSTSAAIGLWADIPDEEFDAFLKALREVRDAGARATGDARPLERHEGRLPAEDRDLLRVRSFADLARRYCDLAEQEAGQPVDLRDLAGLLAAIVAAGFDLPADLDGDTPEPRGDLQYGRVQERFASCANIIYTEVFDPFEDPPSAPVGGSLLDDLQDLYSDLKAGLVAYDAGYTRGAAWQWRFHFTMHWGEHATSAIRALYWYLRHGQ